MKTTSRRASTISCARANGGTLLVKEIAHVGRGPQRKLLARDQARTRRASATRAATSEFCDVRVVAATGVDLSRAVADELFAPSSTSCSARRIEVPPLRDRAEDLPLLFERFGRTKAPRSAATSRRSPRARTTG